MSLTDQSVRKITISIPASLLAYVDARARRLNTSRSRYITQALAQLHAAEEERLAAEGYRYYAPESAEFAKASANAVAEALNHER
jgi:metal-responsive CopG/Arc/MetJ family transcriptional regulator